MSTADEELLRKRAYTIRHTAILAYKHGDITKLELEALLDKLIATERSQLLQSLRDKADTYALRQTVTDEGRDGIKVIAAVELKHIDEAIRRLQGEGA